MTPFREILYSLHSFQHLPKLSLPRTLEGLCELAQPPSRSLNLPHPLLLEQQRNMDTFGCAMLEVPGHLDCTFVENTLFYTVP